MIVLDTTVLIYAVGSEHPLREPCRGLVEAITDGRVEATTTVEVIQEFVHVRARRRGGADAAERGREPLRLLGSVLKRKATIFLVSDFWTGDFSTSLSILSRRHDVVAVRVRDPRETVLPPVGLVRWRDAETGRECLIDTSADVAVRHVALRSGNSDANLERLLASRGVDLMDVDVTRSYVDPLRKFFLAREGRRGRRRSS